MERSTDRVCSVKAKAEGGGGKGLPATTILICPEGYEKESGAYCSQTGCYHIRRHRELGSCGRPVRKCCSVCVESRPVGVDLY